MAFIKIELDYPLEDGMSLTFKAPCDCTAVTGIKVYYPEITDDTSILTSKTFSFRDAHLNALAGLGNLFEAGSTVKVTVDTVNTYAFIQNADTNGYIESKLQAIKSATVTLAANGWTGSTAPYTQRVNVAGIDSNWVAGVPSLVSSGNTNTDLAMQDALACVSLITSGAGTLTFTCYEDKPTVNMTIRVPGVI